MTSRPPLPAWAHFYLSSVIAAGLAVTIYSAYSLYASPPKPAWLILAALTLLTGSFTIRVPSLKARISVSEAFVFISVLMFGPAAATVTVALDSFVISLWMRSDSRSAVRSLFNMAAVALAIWLASHFFFLSIGSQEIGSLRLEQLAFPLFLLAASYFLLNSWLVAFALASERRANPLELWRTNFPWLSLNYFGGASVAGLLVAYTDNVDVGALGVILPLLIISYLTYRTSLGRVDDAKRHVDQIRTLYMSAIETLALAVDAKDQITHGHIRRVQVYATELAKRLGVNAEQQLQALEAAALLHDMGKLAIPEHILNKPGQLTPSEFDTIKTHADIGANLLSSIQFPYPVVPIVRHHHENWDGSGYPAGLSGTDIPLGARILAVVDCFDALTSDRPYRPRLKTEQAFTVLMERRGSMYDPLVVDTFRNCYSDIAPSAIAAGESAPSFTGHTVFGERLHNLRLDNSPRFSPLPGIAGLNPASFEALGQQARELTPATLCVLFRNATDVDLSIATHVSGAAGELIQGLAIPRGERISGWVAAHGTTVVNSDPALDLGPIALRFVPPLRSTLSAPVTVNGRTIGAVTAYTPVIRAFDDGHQRIIEQLTESLAEDILNGQSNAGHPVIPFSQHFKRT